MGINSIVTPDDLRKGEPIKAGWFPAEISNYDEQVTKGSEAKPSDGSINAIYEFTVLDGDPNIKGRKFKKYFNEKAMGFGKNLWVLLFPGSWDAKKGGALTSEMLKSKVGTKLMVYIKKNTAGYDNVEDFRPIEKSN